MLPELKRISQNQNTIDNWLAAQLLLSSKHGPTSDIFFKPKGKLGFPGHCIDVMLLY